MSIISADTKCVSVNCELSFKKSKTDSFRLFFDHSTHLPHLPPDTPQAAPQQQGYAQQGFAPQGYGQAPPGYAASAARPMANFSDLTLIGGNVPGRK